MMMMYTWSQLISLSRGHLLRWFRMGKDLHRVSHPGSFRLVTILHVASISCFQGQHLRSRKQRKGGKKIAKEAKGIYIFLLISHWPELSYVAAKDVGKCSPCSGSHLPSYKSYYHERREKRISKVSGSLCHSAYAIIHNRITGSVIWITSSGDNCGLKSGFATYSSVYLSVNLGIITEQTYSIGLLW